MIRRILVVGCLLALSLGVALAGGKGDMMKAAAGDKMAQEMMKCDVCKHMAPHMKELGPAMTMDMATLNDGVAFMHGVSDPAMLPMYRKVSAEMATAGEACMDYSDEKAASNLCEMCQGIRKAMHSGAKMSMGDTKMGDIMVLTSDDAAVQKQLSQLGTMCEMMMSQMSAM